MVIPACQTACCIACASGSGSGSGVAVEHVGRVGNIPGCFVGCLKGLAAGRVSLAVRSQQPSVGYVFGMTSGRQSRLVKPVPVSPALGL